MKTKYGGLRAEDKSYELLDIVLAGSKSKNCDFSKISDMRRNFAMIIGMIGNLAANINRLTDPDENWDIGVSYNEMRTNTLYAALFLDAYYDFAKSMEYADHIYLRVLGASAYHLCGLSKTASVIVKDLEKIGVYYKNVSFEAEGLECLLAWLLKADFEKVPSLECTSEDRNREKIITEFLNSIPWFFCQGDHDINLMDLATRLVKLVYTAGSPRVLLIGDIISAVIRMKIGKLGG